MPLHCNRSWKHIVFAVALNFFTLSSASAFSLDINMTGFTSSQEAIVNQAEGYWESVITGYQSGITGISAISITATSEYIDGPGDASGNTLGYGGPDYVFSEGGYTFTYSGIMAYDSYDILELESSGTLYDVIVHEIAHILGFGTLWTDNDLYVDNSGKYTGAAALAAYQAEFASGAAFVPVELDGEEGTANGHWDESIGAHELMTGWMDAPTFTSNTTLASFIDLGYTVNISAVPLPAAVWLFGSGLLGLAGWSRRKQAA